MPLDIHQLSLSILLQDKRRLIHDLNLTVQAGQFWCVLGANGAGKSTLLRHLAGLDMPAHIASSGQITFNAHNIKQIAPSQLAQFRAYLPQGRHDVFGYQVLDVVLGARFVFNKNQYWENEADTALAIQALTRFDVAHLAQRDVRSLSGGERQRVALATLLAQDAPLMLLDEPTNSLDLAHQMSTMALLANMTLAAPQNNEPRKTVIMATHDINLAARFASHILMMLPTGGYIAGEVKTVMMPSHLSRCLGHELMQIEQGEQRYFVPL